jgi:hypothetical protein
MNIACAHSIAIHLRAIEWRQIGIGNDVLRKEATTRLREWDGFG